MTTIVRNKLRVLGFVGIGLVSSLCVLTSTNVAAFGLSVEEILDEFKDIIISYVTGDTIKIFTESIEEYQVKLKNIYGGDSEDVKLKAVTTGVSADKNNSVAIRIANERAASDVEPLSSDCTASKGPKVRHYEQSIAQRADQESVLRRDSLPRRNELAKKSILNKKAALELKNDFSKPEAALALPKTLDASYFITTEGYLGADAAKVAKSVLDKMLLNTDPIKAEDINPNLVMNPVNVERINAILEKSAALSYAKEALIGIYNARLRDRESAATLAATLSDGEVAIFKSVSTEDGVSLIDILNFEALVSAYEYSTIEEILAIKTHANGESDNVQPSEIRAYRTMARTKTIESAFAQRLETQNATIAKLQSIFLKQLVSKRMDA